MRYILAVVFPAVLVGCGTVSTDALKPHPARMIDYTIDVQPIVVYGDWDLQAWSRLAAQLGPAYSSAGVAFRILDPILLPDASWERIDSEAELRAMMNGTFDGVRVWLVEDVAPECLGSTGNLMSSTGVAGAAFPPTSVDHGITLTIGATRDRNTLVHEMGHALGLDHPTAGVGDCSVPEIACQFMSYCFATRNQFTPEQIETIRHWAAVLAN